MIRQAVVLAVVSGVAVLSAQAPSNPRTFEAASVRLAAPDTRTTARFTGTRVDLTNMPLRGVLLTAFRLKEYQLSAPDWMGEVRVDIHATLPTGGTRQQAPEMLQQLLAERFGLVVRHESRSIEAYELAVGTEGMKIQEGNPRDELNKEFPPDPGFTSPQTRELADRVSETPDGSVRTIMANLGRTTVTARTMFTLRLTDRRTQILDATRMTMVELATVLARSLDQPVIDRTSLTGVYQFTIELPLDAAVVRLLLGPARSDPPAVSAFQAVEGLGLKLEQRRSAANVVVVEKMERRPTEN